MATTVKYIGTADNYAEIAATGKQSVWQIGQQEERSDVEAGQLLATGLFTTPDVPVIGLRNPVTGGSEILVSAGEKLGKISAITYNADGTLATYTQDRVTWTCAYDSAGRLSSETSQGGGTVKTYTYNPDGTLATVGVV